MLLTYEEILPDIIINGGEVADYKGVVDFLEAVKSGGSDKLDDSSLGGVVYNFLKLSQDVNELSMATTTDEEQDGAAARIDKLLAQAKELQSTLSRTASLATDTKTARPASRFFSGVTVTSREMCLTNLCPPSRPWWCTSISSGWGVAVRGVLYRLRPAAIDEGVRKLKKTSELMFAWSTHPSLSSTSAQLNLQGVLGLRNFLRGTYGLA